MGDVKWRDYELFTVKDDGTLWYVKVAKFYIDIFTQYKAPPNIMPSDRLGRTSPAVMFHKEKVLRWKVLAEMRIEQYERNMTNQRYVELAAKKREARIKIALEMANVALNMIAVFVPVMGLGKVVTLVLLAAPTAVEAAQFVISDEKSKMLGELLADNAFEFLAKQGFNFVFPSTAKLLKDADRITKNNKAVLLKRKNKGLPTMQKWINKQAQKQPKHDFGKHPLVDKAGKTAKAKFGEVLSKEEGLAGEFGYVINSIYVEKPEGFSPQCDADVVLAQIHMFRYAKDMVYKQNYDAIQSIMKNWAKLDQELMIKQPGMKSGNPNDNKQDSTNIYPPGSPMLPRK